MDVYGAGQNPMQEILTFRNHLTIVITRILHQRLNGLQSEKPRFMQMSPMFQERLGVLEI